MSLRCLKQISIERHLPEASQKRRLFCDVFKTSQIHLKKDVLFVTSLRRLKYISKKLFFLGDAFKASQTYLKKGVYSLASLIYPKNIS